MTARTKEEAEQLADAAKGSAFTALTYDPFLWWAERRGMAGRRRALVSSARGSVLELGAGTGMNLQYYPEGVERLVITEPEPHMAARLEKKLDRLGLKAELVRAPAEALPFDDDEFDTVVITLALCTIPDPEVAIAEVRRVLRPDGSFLFLEHVRSESPRLGRWQDRLHGPWKAFADGCNCNRRTAELVRAGGFEISELENAEWRGMPRLVRPLASGRARPV